VLIIQTVR